MNFVDIFVVSIIGLFAFFGFVKGFIPQLFQFVGLYCAFAFNASVSKWIGTKISEDPEGAVLLLTGIAAFLLIYSIFFITGYIVSKTVNLTLTSIPNRTAGIFFGAIKGFFVVCTIMLILRLVPAGDDFLKKYVTPDRFVDETLNSSLNIASENLDNDYQDELDSMKLQIPKDTEYESENNKIYSRLGYLAYRISTMMDPFINNLKTIFSEKAEEIIDEKINQKIQEKMDEFKDE